jgi:hypothetical protein
MLYEYIKVFLEASPLLTFDDHMKAIDDANNIDDINRKVKKLESPPEDAKNSEDSVEEFKRLLNPINYMPRGLTTKPAPKKS